MAENKTAATEESVAAFLDGVTPIQRAAEARQLCSLFEQATGEKPVLWGPSIIGFGRYRYRYASGRQGEGARVGFSPRKAHLVFYGLLSAPGADQFLARLGKHATGKGCLYVKRLDEVSPEIMTELIALGFRTPKPDEVDKPDPASA
jgi:hypothetical protein